MADAVQALHPYTDELFEVDNERQQGIDQGIFSDHAMLKTQWQNTIDAIFVQAKLTLPEAEFPQTGGRKGLHTEDFGMLLAQLQYLPRAYPGASW